MPKSEPNELNLIWIYTKKHSPDCRGCFPNPRNLHKSRKKGLRICYDTRIRFWTLKAKIDALNEEIEILECQDPLEGYEVPHNEGYD